MSNSLQNKMYNYEVKPPQDLWNKISDDLDENAESYELSLRLYDLEATPPASAWQHIKSELQTNPATVSRSKIVPYLLRMAAAVVIITLMVFGGIRLFNNHSGKDELAANKNSGLIKDSLTPSAIMPATTTPQNTTARADEKNDDEALEESKRTLAKNEFSERTKLKIARESYLSAPAHYIESSSILSANLHYSDILQPLLENEASTEDLSDRYIMLKSADGNFFRMSKKLADLICCITGEEQDAGCKDQLQRWREKIACSPLAPAPGNFMDILSLITSLQNDKN